MAAHASMTAGFQAGWARETALTETRLGGTMGDSEDDPTTWENLGLVDNGVIGMGLYKTSVQSGSGFLAFPFENALADVLAPWVEDSARAFSDATAAFASASKSRKLRLVTASMIAWRARNSSAPLSSDMKKDFPPLMPV
jgi:hypothetical protein